MLAAVAVLRLTGAVAVATVGKIKRTGDAPADVAELPGAIYSVLVRPEHAGTVRNEPQTRSALNAIRACLVAAGLRVSIRRRGSLGVLAVGVLGGGVTRLVANSFGWLDLSITLVSTAVGVAIWGTARRTRAGVRTLRTLRDRYPVPADDAELSPEVGGMMVALHGRLDLGDIDNITARPGRRRGTRRRDDNYSDSGHYSKQSSVPGDYSSGLG